MTFNGYILCHIKGVEEACHHPITSLQKVEKVNYHPL